MLTKRQSQLLTYIARYQDENAGTSPSFEEMRAGISLASKSGIHRLVKGLIERGFLAHEYGHARALRVVKFPQPLGLSGAYSVSFGGNVNRYGVLFAIPFTTDDAALIAQALNAYHSPTRKSQTVTQ